MKSVPGTGSPPMPTIVELPKHKTAEAALEALIAHARAHGAARIWCNARVPAKRLYERGGFVCVSAVFELPRIGPHVVMELC